MDSAPRAARSRRARTTRRDTPRTLRDAPSTCSFRHVAEARMTGARVPPDGNGWGREREMLSSADSNLETQRHIGIGVPAHGEWQVHVFARVQLRSHMGAESMANAEGERTISL